MALSLVLGVLALRQWVGVPVRVRDVGMEPTFCQGDLVWVWRGAVDELVPGDIVLFHEPGTPLRYLRRVLATGGQRVELHPDGIWLDGQRVDRPGGQVKVGEVAWQVRGLAVSPPREVPPGELFLLGDHLAETTDSRVLGTVSLDQVEGRAGALIWEGASCGRVADE